MKTNIYLKIVAFSCVGLINVGCGGDWLGIDDDAGDAIQDTVTDTGVNDIASDARDTTVADSQIVDSFTPDTTADVPVEDLIMVEEVVGVDTNPEFMEERLGWAWASSPADGEPIQVTVGNLESKAGKLTGTFAEVWNCLKEPGGEQQTIPYGGAYYDVALCHYVQTVTPGEDGSYLHILPTASPRDPNDQFAEVMTYYSMNRVHDFFQDTFGHTESDRSLFSVVNIQFQIEGGDYWMPLDNAAFMPDASYGFMGFNMHDGEMLAFGQGENIDFCSDASVVFHEYTHFLIGSNRLYANRGDRYGFSGDPAGMNEGFADYFASTILGNPVLGEYSLGDQSRDLSGFRKCPDNYVGQSHYDGQIWSTSLWEIRTTIGAEIADQLAYRALIGCTVDTSFGEAAQFVMDACAELSPENSETVRLILEKHNVIDCSRVIEAGSELAKKTYYVPGTMDSYVREFQSSVPSTFQYKIVVPEGKTSFVAYFRAEDISGYGEPEVKLLVKTGDEQIVWSFRYGAASNDADKSFLSEKISSQDVAFTVGGSCIQPGVYHIQLLNKSSGTIVSKLNNVSFLDAMDGEPNWNTCSQADDTSAEGVVTDVIGG